MTEKQVEGRLTKGIKARKGLCIKLLPFNFTGLPDRLCLLPGGRMFFIELKKPNKKLRKIQMHVILKIKSLGFEVHVADSMQSVDAILAKYEYPKVTKN